MFRDVRFSQVAAIIFLAALAGCQVTPATNTRVDASDVNYEGLATVTSKAFDLAQVRPGIDFGAYSRVRLDAPELAYRKPDRDAGEVLAEQAGRLPAQRLGRPEDVAEAIAALYAYESQQPEVATTKAKDLVRMAVAKVALYEPLAEPIMKINQAALVIGGGGVRPSSNR